MQNNNIQNIYDVDFGHKKIPKMINPSGYKMRKVGFVRCEPSADRMHKDLTISMTSSISGDAYELRDIQFEIIELLRERGFFVGKLQVDF